MTRRNGFSYIEVLIVTVLISVSLLPAMEALQAGIQASTVTETRSINQFRLQGRMEKVLAQSLAALHSAADSVTTINSTYSDPLTEPDRLLVYIAPYDVRNTDADDDPFTGGDSSVLWVRVAIAGSGDLLETLVYAL